MLNDQLPRRRQQCAKTERDEGEPEQPIARADGHHASSSTVVRHPPTRVAYAEACVEPSVVSSRLIVRDVRKSKRGPAAQVDSRAFVCHRGALWKPTRFVRGSSAFERWSKSCS